MYDFNFMDNKKMKIKLLLIIIVLVIILLSFYLYFASYTNYRKNNSYINENIDKLEVIKNQENEIEHMKESLKSIKSSNGKADLDKLIKAVYLDKDIDYIGIDKDYIRLEGKSLNKENIERIRLEVSKDGFKDIEIREVNYMEDEKSYRYILESDLYEK